MLMLLQICFLSQTLIVFPIKKIVQIMVAVSWFICILEGLILRYSVINQFGLKLKQKKCFLLDFFYSPTTADSRFFNSLNLNIEKAFEISTEKSHSCW